MLSSAPDEGMQYFKNRILKLLKLPQMGQSIQEWVK